MPKNSATIIIKESRGKRIIEQSRMRVLCVGFFFVLCFTSISFKMIDVAVINNSHAMTVTFFNPDNEDENEQVELKNGTQLTLQRGDIVDRNGILLATNLMTASVYVKPQEIKNAKHVAKLLSQVLSMDEQSLLKLIDKNLDKNKKRKFVWIKRRIPPPEQKKINDLGITGVYLQPEEKRVYPYGNMLSHLLGYVNVDNKGLAGIERQFDNRLRESSVNTDPLVLSVDVRLQTVIHEEISKTMSEFRAIGATGIILDIDSGELLSMVSLPDFDPQKEAKPSNPNIFNRATMGIYEMGSTFKTFTMAMGLDYGVTSMKGGYDTTGPYKFSSIVINDDEPMNRFLTVPEIFSHSSNIGSTKMAISVGIKRQKEFLDKLGMLKPVDIEFPEKSSPQIPQNWNEISMATIAYGHGISVTPLHMIAGVASLVNGGTREKLTLLKDGNKNKAKGERIASQQTSENVRRLMRLVVSHGTGSNANVSGYHVGGKTGTAEKQKKGGGYDKNANMLSFIATFPIDKPKYVVLVMLDEPQGNKSTKNNRTAAWIAVPVVGEVIARMAPILGIKPRYNVPEDDAEKFWVNNTNNKPKKPDLYTSPMMDKRYTSVAY